MNQNNSKGDLHRINTSTTLFDSAATILSSLSWNCVPRLITALLEHGAKSTVGIWCVLTISYLALVSCAGSNQNLASPTPAELTLRPLPSSSPTRLPTPTNTATVTPIPTLEPLALPTSPPGAELQTFSPDPNRTGWFGSNETQPHWSDTKLFSGVFQGQMFVSVVQFDLQSLAPNSKIVFAALEITERDASQLGIGGEWYVDLIGQNVINGNQISFDAVNKAPTLGVVGGPLSPQSIAPNLRKRFIVPTAQIPVFEKQLDAGKITFRLRGPSTGTDNLFVWDASSGPAEPRLYVLLIPAQFVAITNTPIPNDVFAAATLVTKQTVEASAFGTPTPLSRSFATVTPGPNYVVITSVPTAVNPAAAVATSVYATAVAVTTGTFTPFPFDWVTATPPPVLIPLKSLTPVPTMTPTIAPLGIPELAKKPLPGVLYNKIVFLSGDRSAPIVWAMDPNGSNLALLTDRTLYDIAAARDLISPDGVYFLYNAPDNTENAIVQIWRANLKSPTSPPDQITFHGAGTAFAPAWHPDGTKIAYTRILGDGTQEIYFFDLNATTDRQWPRLTFSQDLYLWNQHPSWSPDGKQIVFASDRGHIGSFTEIWIMNADGSNAKNLGNGTRNAWDPVWIKWKQ